MSLAAEQIPILNEIVTRSYGKVWHNKCENCCEFLCVWVEMYGCLEKDIQVADVEYKHEM